MRLIEALLHQKWNASCALLELLQRSFRGKKMNKKLFVTTAIGLSMVLVPGTTFAQSTSESAAENSNDENVIIVSARRRDESVQDVPVVIEAISAEQIESRGISNVDDIAKYTPGLTFDRGISLQDTRPVIRGLPATRGRPPVGVLLDGIDISTEALGNAGGGSLLNSRLLDLERIEVVKGPQSALYGRAAFAGAINYITKRPTSDFSGEISGSYGSFDTYDIGAAVSGPISDKFGFRVSVKHAQSNGDYNNPVSGADLNAYETTGGSLGLEFDSGEGVNIYLRSSYSEYEYAQAAIQNISGFVAGNVSRPGPTTPEGIAVQVGIDGGALVGGFGPVLPSNVPPRGDIRFTGVTGLSIDPRTGSDFPGSDGSTFSTTLNVEADLGPFEFVYNGGYVSQKERLVYDGDFFGLPLATFVDGTAEPLNLFDVVDFDNDLTLISQEVRFQSLDTEPLRWAVGGLYWHSDMEQDSRSLRTISGFPLNGTPSVAGFSGTSLLLASTINSSPFRRKIDSFSVYGLVEFDITDRLTVGAEARYISEDTSVTRSDFLQAAFAPVSAAFINPVQRSSISDDDIVPRFSINYDVSDDVLVYASAAKGFKPAGISELDFGSLLEDSRFQAETVWNYEAGFKATLADRQVTFNAAVFFMDWTDKQVTQLVEDPAAPSGFRASVQNAGAAEVLGLDASIVLRPNFAPGLTFDVGYTYLDATYTDFTVATNSAFTVTEGANCTIGTVGTGTVCLVSYDGNRLERAPKHQIVSNLNYRAELSSDLDFIFGASVQYQSDRFLTESNRLTLPSYVNVDMQVGLEFGNYMIQGFVQNLTKEDAVRSAQNNFDLSTFGRSVNAYAPPRRTFGVRARAKF